MTLWNQQGSRVSRGSLIVIPIEQSLLYVQPLYLQATEGQMPELKRVIVAYGNRIAMESSLDNALAKIFGGVVSTSENVNARSSQNEQTTVITATDISTLSRSALDRYLKAEEYMRAGNWAKYGEELELLKKDLMNIVEQSRTR
jgi:uncharacterized membrane protein (UPF0182 family)